MFRNIDEKLSKINTKYSNSNLIIGENINVRIADKGEIDAEHLTYAAIFTINRESEDTIINERGRNLIEFADRIELFITIGRFPSDILACYIFINT